MRLLARAAVVLLVGLPAMGYAQAEDAPVGAPGASTPPPLVPAPAEPEPPPPGEIIPRSLEPQARTSNYAVPRLLLSPIVGTVASAGGALLGGLLSSTISDCDLVDGPCDNFFAAVAPPLVGLGFTSSLVVYGMGSLLRGEGGLLPSLAGSSAGMVLAIATSNVTDYGVILLLPPLSAVGAVVGYELSHALRRPGVERVQLGWRIPAEVLVGAAGGALGFLVGYSAVDYGGCRAGFSITCGRVSNGVGFAGYVAAASLGVYGAGSVMGAPGTYWASLIGAGVGALTGAGTAGLFSLTSEGLTLVSIIVLPIAGTVVGYELLPELWPQYFSRSEPAPTEDTALELVPVISVPRAGGLVGGLAGRF